MQIHLSSLTSTQEISDTRLHRDLVISKHTAQSFLDSMLQSMTFLVDVMQERFTQWLSSLQHLHKHLMDYFHFNKDRSGLSGAVFYLKIA